MKELKYVVGNNKCGIWINHCNDKYINRVASNLEK